MCQRRRGAAVKGNSAGGGVASQTKTLDRARGLAEQGAETWGEHMHTRYKFKKNRSYRA